MTDPPFISAKFSATKSPCTWNSGSECKRTSSELYLHASVNISAFATRLLCVIMAPFGLPVVPEV